MFSLAAPKLWNKLPLHIRQADSLPVLKSSLKTTFFLGGPFWPQTQLEMLVLMFNYYFFFHVSCFYDFNGSLLLLF